MKRWIEPTEILVPQSLRTLINGHPLVAQTLVRRGLTDPKKIKAFLDPDYYSPAPPSDLPDLVRAAERLMHAIHEQESICVWGDFDVDGQTSTTLLVSGLRTLGAKVSYHIPVRGTESHGVNLPALKRVIDDGAQLVLTCDTGVDAQEAVEYAQTRGADVIITDHHKLPPELPNAHAVVNPQRLTAEHPLRGLPGVGVAYKLMQHLYETMKHPEDTSAFLDLVALGIVADVADVRQDNRFLLQRGLATLRTTKRVGLQQMMSLLALDPSQLTEEHIGFQLAPRLNALGRLSDANPIVDFLTTDDEDLATSFASRLEQLNAERKLMCDQVLAAALDQIERDSTLLDHSALVLAHEAWPAGVVGIVASRLAEQFNRPTLLLCAPNDELARGSARSVPGCDITRAISAHADLLEGFGGHTMAAGLSIKKELLPEFRIALGHTVESMLGTQLIERELEIDGFLSLSELSLALIDDLEQLAPFGPGNPPIALATRNLTLRSHAPLGKSGDHLQLQVEDEQGNNQRIIWWQGAGLPLPQGRFDLAYAARINTFRGKRNLQLEWIDSRPLVAQAPEFHAPKPKLVDCRSTLNPESKLSRILARMNVQVWAEGKYTLPESVRRDQLKPSDELVIWTIPAGPNVFRQLLSKASPRTVYLFGNDPGLDKPPEFLHHLAGLTKYALGAKDGRTSIEELVGASAHTEITVRKGLAWLIARGIIGISEGQSNHIHISEGGRPDRKLADKLMGDIQELLRETAAYRTHYLESNIELLI